VLAMLLELLLPARQRLRTVIATPVRVDEREGHYVA
jgi:hypothetical protein